MKLLDNGKPLCPTCNIIVKLSETYNKYFCKNVEDIMKIRDVCKECGEPLLKKRNGLCKKCEREVKRKK